MKQAFDAIKNDLLFEESACPKTYLRANLEAFFHIAKHKLDPSKPNYLAQLDELANYARERIQLVIRLLAPSRIKKAEKYIQDFVFKQRLAHQYLKKFVPLEYHPGQSSAVYKQNVAQHYKELLKQFLEFVYELKDAEKIAESGDHVKAKFLEMMGPDEGFAAYRNKINTILNVRVLEINKKAVILDIANNFNVFYDYIDQEMSFPDVSTFSFTSDSNLEPEEEGEEEEKEEKEEVIEKKIEVQDQPKSVWRIRKTGGQITVLDFPEKDLMEIKSIKKDEEKKTGHESCKIIVRKQDDKNQLFFLKFNKDEHPQLSWQERIASTFWNIFAPEISASVAPVFDEKERGRKILGLISPGIEGFSELQRNVDYKDKEKYLNFRSIAIIWTLIHLFCEDDGHLQNFGVIPVSENGRILLTLFKIDHDMTWQLVAEAEGYGGLNKRMGRFYDRASDLEKVTLHDCKNNPMFRDFKPHFSPGRSQLYVGGSSLLDNIKNSTKKGWGPGRFGVVHAKNLDEQHKWLKDHQEYIKWKWYKYAHVLFTDLDFIKKELIEAVADVEDAEERKAAHDILLKIFRAFLERTKKFSKELGRCPEFKEALSKHRDEYLFRMALDNIAYWRIYKCKGEIDLRKLIENYDGREGKKSGAPEKIKCSRNIIKEIQWNFQKTLEACRTVAEIQKMRHLFTQLTDNCEPLPKATQHFGELVTKIRETVDKRITQLVRSEKAFDNFIQSIQAKDLEEKAVKQAMREVLTRMFDLFDSNVNNPFYQQAKDKILKAYFNHPAVKLKGKEIVKNIEEAKNFSDYRNLLKVFERHCQRKKEHFLLGAWYRQQLDQVSDIQPKFHQKIRMVIEDFRQSIDHLYTCLKIVKNEKQAQEVVMEPCENNYSKSIKLLLSFSDEQDSFYQRSKNELSELRNNLLSAYRMKLPLLREAAEINSRGRFISTKDDNRPPDEINSRGRLISTEDDNEPPDEINSRGRLISTEDDNGPPDERQANKDIEIFKHLMGNSRG